MKENNRLSGLHLKLQSGLICCLKTKKTTDCMWLLKNSTRWSVGILKREKSLK